MIETQRRNTAMYESKDLHVGGVDTLIIWHSRRIARFLIVNRRASNIETPALVFYRWLVYPARVFVVLDLTTEHFNQKYRFHDRLIVIVVEIVMSENWGPLISLVEEPYNVGMSHFT